MTQKFTISARNADRFLGDDEAHVGEYAGKTLTRAEADKAIAYLNVSRPDGHEDVVYVADEVAESGAIAIGFVNETGRAEIARFLADHHKLGAQRFGRAEIAAWAADAEQALAEGNSPTIEIRATDSVTGAAVCYTVSPAGVTQELRLA